METLDITEILEKELNFSTEKNEVTLTINLKPNILQIVIMLNGEIHIGLLIPDSLVENGFRITGPFSIATSNDYYLETSAKLNGKSVFIKKEDGRISVYLQ